MKTPYLLLCSIVTGILGSLVIIMEVSRFSDSNVSMLLGMGLGISTSPIMMARIKNLGSKRKVNKILKEVVERQKCLKSEDTK